jgi:CheY-like chemotaxis protein
MAKEADALSELKILVVEDNFLIAESIRDVFEERGCKVLGPVANVRNALAVLGQHSLNGAILDINLNGEYSFPIAQALSERGIPFFFLTGYDDVGIIPSDLRDVQRISKPFDAATLARVAILAFLPAANSQSSSLH